MEVALIFLISTLFALLLLLYIYVRYNDKKIMRQPDEVAAVASDRFTPEMIHRAAADLAKNPVSITNKLPPRTGRRYIVVGGAGFLGGWIVIHLLQRGEDPRRIRVIDLHPPFRLDLKTSPAKDIEFIQADISNSGALLSAFTKPWPQRESPEPEVTVFSVAAAIRFYERDLSLVPLSAKVNVAGVQNVIDASHACGASVLVCTSSGSVGIRSTRFLLGPWEKQPDFFVQVLRDDDDLSSKPHHHHFSNYSYTKLLGEQLVRSADRSRGFGGRVLRTGCIRPGNGIYGSQGDTLFELYLKRKFCPSWILNMVQNFVYVENCSLAHLCYEQRLLELIQGGKNVDIGGKAFIVTDAGPPIRYSDAYTVLNLLKDGKPTILYLSSSIMLLLAHIIESYYLLAQSLSKSTFTPFRILSYVFPHRGVIFSLQPSVWSLTNVHLVFDDSKAKAPPEEGGLGYDPPWTSLTGLCKLVDEFKKNRKIEERHEDTGGSKAISGLVNAECGVQQGLEVVEALAVDIRQVLK